MISSHFDEIIKVNVKSKDSDLESSDVSIYIMDDTLLYCYECEKDIHYGCKFHSFDWILNKSLSCTFSSAEFSKFDKYVNKTEAVTSCDCQENETGHLKNSLPSVLCFKPSSLYPDEIGVWSKILISKGTVFGPFLGKVTEIKEIHSYFYERSINGYAWLIWKSLNCQVQSLIDAGNCFNANWLRNVKSCVEIDRQNLLAIQFDGLIFYRACQDIEENSELLVSYEIQHERDVELAKRVILKTLSLNEKISDDVNKIDHDTTKASEIEKPSLLSHVNISSPKKLKLDSSVFEDVEPSDNTFNNNNDNNNAAKAELNKNCSSQMIYSKVGLLSNIISPFSGIAIVPFNIPIQTTSFYNFPVEQFDKNLNPYMCNNASKQINQPTNLYKSYFNFPCPTSLSNFAPHVNQFRTLSNFHTNRPVNLLSMNKDLSSINFSQNSSSAGFTLNNYDIDEETIGFVIELCKSEPFICLENIIELIIDRFPEKKYTKGLRLINILKSKSFRPSNTFFMGLDEDIISAVVKLYQIDPQLSIFDIQCKLIKMYPHKSTVNGELICHIIKSNFPTKKLGYFEKELFRFVEKLVRKSPNLTVNEIFLKVQRRYPERKTINSIIINKILDDINMRNEKQTLDVIDMQVKKIVHQICYEFKEN